MSSARAKQAAVRAPDSGGAPIAPMLEVVKAPHRIGFEDAWIGIEPTFNNAKMVQKWAKMAIDPAGEDAYFQDPAMLKIERGLAKAICRKYRDRLKEGNHSYCLFQKVVRKDSSDAWNIPAQSLVFQLGGGALTPLRLKLTLDAETTEFTGKFIPLAWLYQDEFVRFMQEFIWDVALSRGLTTSVLHGGAQFSLSVKTLLQGSLLADDTASRLDHPELSTFILDTPEADARAFRATGKRMRAIRDLVDQYWKGAFHPRAKGVPAVEQAILDCGWEPARDPGRDLMDTKRGPAGDEREIFQTNFVFGRALRVFGQNVHPGYWQSVHPRLDGYKPHQVMRYSETNLNRLQIVGELDNKSEDPIQPEDAFAFDAPLEPGMLTREARWENRAQMCRTSARDFVEAVLLDVHYMQYLARHPRPKVRASLLQDQLLSNAVDTLRKYGKERTLARLRKQALRNNLEESRGRIKSDWIEPETLFWEAWKALPKPEKAAVAHEAVLGFIERVENAATADPRPLFAKDPMEWQRHRVHPILWHILQQHRRTLKAGDPVRHELDLFVERRESYLARRPIASPAPLRPPWRKTT